MSNAAVDELCAQYSGRVMNFLVADGLDYPEAWLVALDTFAALTEKYQKLPVPCDAGQEVFAFALKERDNFLWQRQVGIKRELPSIAIPAGDKTAMLRSRILEAMKNLPSPMRTVYALSRCGKLKYSEISAITGDPSESVGLRVRRAKEKLARALKELKYAEP